MASKPEHRVIAVLIGLTIGLAGALVFVVVRGTGTGPGLDGESVRQDAIDELIARSSGTWDAYQDADVGRVLLANLEGRSFRSTPVSSNRLGMREEAYAVPKKGSRPRVVLLGDSYVFGYGVRAEERLGVHLEGFLRKGASKKPARVEVLHLGISSWNITSEANYLRRQIGDLQPDLVVMVTFKNDLADMNGVRGFGEMGKHSPQARGRGSAIMNNSAPSDYAGGKIVTHHLDFGLDWASRTRYDAAATEIEELADALERYGIPFVLVIHWQNHNAIASSYFARSLDPDEVAFVPDSFCKLPEYWNSDEDRHWNGAGHERVAKMLYGLIEERDLLPALALDEWDEGRDEFEWFDAEAQAEIAAAKPYDGAVLRSYVSVPAEDKAMMSQVYYGLRANGRTQAHAAVMLKRDGGSELVIEGGALGRAELETASARVFVEEFEVGGFPLGSGASFPYVFALPAETLERDYLTVRVACDDFVYEKVATGDDAAWRLETLRIR